MTLTRLGSYPVEREVGRGGMGVVYLGRDPRLGRPVALKVLPEAFARDPERLARFEREARLLAALSHANIAGIFGLEEADGHRFLALEYVEGETLAAALARGPLPLDETLEVCIQIAGALEAAHEAGIVHRDLKPGNVKLTPSGQVKVLDFGLAKGAAVTGDSNPDLSQSPTMTEAPTGVGVVLGTAAYMSPEQARGKVVDRRTDIWSFGCVLYECLTGTQAFAGETVSDMIALILQGEPDWTKLPKQTPERLRALLRRCLEKDARRRLRDIGDARIELEELRAARTSGITRIAGVETAPPQAVRSSTTRRSIATTIAMLVAGAAIGAGIFAWIGARPDSKPFRFTIQSPPHYELSFDPNYQAISPDGRTMVFAATDSSGNWSLWLRPLASFAARQLPGSKNAQLPFWSPDSREIAFFADGKLKRLRISGGSPGVICDAANGRGGSWSSKGLIVFAPAPGGPLYQIRPAGGRPFAVTVIDTAQGETAHRWPCFLPDGEHFLYAAVPARQGEYNCYIGSLHSPKRRPLFAASGAPIYAAPDHLIYMSNDALVAQRFDLRGLKTVGDPVTIGEAPPPTTMTAAPCASVSRNGVLAWQRAGLATTKLDWMSRDGRTLGTLGIPLDRWTQAILSPDGKRALIQRAVESGNSDIWVVDLVREIANRLTSGTEKNTLGVWSPDSREVLYSSTRNGFRDIYRRSADGSGSEQLFYKSSVPFKDATDWSPDGRFVLVQQIADSTGWNLYSMPASGGPLTPWVATPSSEQYGFFSPNGKWVLYTSNESGTPQIYVQSFPAAGSKQQVSKSGAFVGLWSNHGREIVLLRPDLMVMSVPVEWGDAPHFGTPRELFRMPQEAQGYWPTPDGQRFLIALPSERRTPGISIAVNWRAEIER